MKPIQINPYKQYSNNSRDTLFAITKRKYFSDSVYLARLKDDFLYVNRSYDDCMKRIDLYKTEITQGLYKQENQHSTVMKTLSELQTKTAELNNHNRQLEKKIKANKNLTIGFGITTVALLSLLAFQ